VTTGLYDKFPENDENKLKNKILTKLNADL